VCACARVLKCRCTAGASGHLGRGQGGTRDWKQVQGQSAALFATCPKGVVYKIGNWGAVL
jgi:hypothetical protein